MYKKEQDIKSEITEDNVKETNLIDINQLIDDAWKGFKKYWIYLLVLISVCSSIFYLYAKKTYKAEYTAMTTFIVNTNQVLNYSGDYYNKVTAEQLAKTFPYIISNNALQHMIAEDLGFSEIPAEITAETMEETNMVTIKVTSSNPQTAYDVLQSVIENYPNVARSVIGETQLNILDETGVPKSPSNPKNFKSMAKRGLLAGCVLSVVILLFYALTRKTIRKEGDIKKFISIKCFGTIPMAKFKKTRYSEQNMVLIDNKRIPYGFVESNRTIRTRVEKEMRENNSQVFLVTSATAGEGKTTVAVNLALSLATKEKKVILVDGDMRHPTVCAAMGLSNSQNGLSDILTGKALLENTLIQYKDTKLRVIPGGKPIKHTDKFLSGDRVKVLFEELKQIADYIIVDTPPCGLVFDAAMIAKYADAGIFVVRQDYTSLNEITEGIEMLEDTNIRLAGCVLNCAEVGITGYGYGKGYGYYGYGRYGRYGKYNKYGYENINREEHDEND